MHLKGRSVFRNTWIVSSFPKSCTDKPIISNLKMCYLNYISSHFYKLYKYRYCFSLPFVNIITHENISRIIYVPENKKIEVANI